MKYKINEARLTASEYINFLKRTDLGSQYPKERFEERINTLVNKVSISLVARNEADEKIGMKTPKDVMVYNKVEWTDFVVE